MKKWRLITVTSLLLLLLGLFTACGSKETKVKEDAAAAAESPAPEQSISTKGPDSAGEQVTVSGMDSKEENSYLRIEKCSARADQDYLHVSYDPILLGNGENLILTITATPTNLSAEDFYISYDSSFLSAEITDVSDNEPANETIAKVSVSAVSPGTSELSILSSYDLTVLPEEEWRGISYRIKGLDSKDGQIVYVTPTGEKYHFSAECAGENAIGTTLYDAVADEFGPCGKCAG